MNYSLLQFIEVIIWIDKVEMRQQLRQHKL